MERKVDLILKKRARTEACTADGVCTFVIDIINTALTRPDIKTFLLFTGDKDFIRVVTTLRNLSVLL